MELILEERERKKKIYSEAQKLAKICNLVQLMIFISKMKFRQLVM